MKYSNITGKIAMIDIQHYIMLFRNSRKYGRYRRYWYVLLRFCLQVLGYWQNLGFLYVMISFPIIWKAANISFTVASTSNFRLADILVCGRIQIYTGTGTYQLKDCRTIFFCLWPQTNGK